MKTLVILKQSFKAIMTNKGRSFLTTLGIIIGIGSVIALVAMGAGVQATINSRVSKLGSRNLMISPGAGFGGGAIERAQQAHGGQATSGPQGGGIGGGGSTSTLTQEDYDSLLDTDKHPLISSVSASVNGSAVFTTTEGQEQRYSVVGTTPSNFKIQDMRAAKGRVLTNQDIADKNKVVVLGYSVVKDLFGDKNPIGQKLTISETQYQVVGALAKVEETGFGNRNAQSFISYTAARESFNTENFSSLTAVAVSDAKVTAAKEDIEKTLLKNHGIDKQKLADFSVYSAADILSTVETISGTMTALLAGIAAISLLVGGIGIMNIMLVSVTERTREIGLRKAVGAKTRHILGQFVTEAVLLTLTGGVLGIGFGFLLARVATQMLGFAPVITANAILLAVGVSTAVGLIFGIYPAAKASRLDPIEALRYE